MIVTKENKPYGIFTERDLLSKVLVGGNLGDEVGKYVSAPLITIPPDTSVRDSARIMAEKRIKRLVIVENDEIKGIFTASDLANVVAKIVGSAYCPSCGEYEFNLSYFEKRGIKKGDEFECPRCGCKLMYGGIVRNTIYVWFAEDALVW